MFTYCNQFWPNHTHGSSARKTSHKHNNKDLSRLRYLSPGMPVSTRSINILEEVPQVEFMYLVFTGISYRRRLMSLKL